MTAEDPVEYNFRGINQVQIREQIGLTFAAALRSFLRQIPISSGGKYAILKRGTQSRQR
jgi:hypothetical protein